MCKHKAEDLEVCVLCHQILPVKKDTHLANRENYIEGAGQLCDDCMNIVYGELLR